MRTPLILAFASVCGTLSSAAALDAQHTVEGRVVSAENGLPIEDATIRVVGEGLTLGTDSLGAFRFELPGDRAGFALEIEVIGFAPMNRTWILPLEAPLLIGLEREAVPIEGIDVEVDRPTGWTARPLEYKLEFRVRSQQGIDRVAGLAELRAFEHQQAEIWDFLPEMTVAPLLDGGFFMSGRVENPGFIMDDRNVVFDEFRSYPVEDICRIEVVTIPVPGARKSGFVQAYTCDFLMDVATGERSLSPFLPTMPARE